MCLYTNEENPFYAEEDIKVFKVLTPANHGPCMSHYVYHHGKNVPLVEDILQGLNKNATYRPPHYWTRTVDKGYLHAWKYLSDAIDMAEDYGGELRVVEMYVPKGATYYLGVDGDIAASELVWPNCAPEYGTKRTLKWIK